jgi:uncharacterized protein
MAATFEVDKDEEGKFRWHLKAANGEIIAFSQASYDTEADAEEAIEAVLKAATEAGVDIAP